MLGQWFQECSQEQTVCTHSKCRPAIGSMTRQNPFSRREGSCKGRLFSSSLSASCTVYEEARLCFGGMFWQRHKAAVWSSSFRPDVSQRSYAQHRRCVLTARAYLGANSRVALTATRLIFFSVEIRTKQPIRKEFKNLFTISRWYGSLIEHWICSWHVRTTVYHETQYLAAGVFFFFFFFAMHSAFCFGL